tara:strand:+ start:495 stop:851 length:357 start_codon:yes stop_codon:yes gene_type:complete
MIHDSFSHERGSSHTFERAYTTGLAFRTMHAAGIKLHYTICVWTAPISDACVIWIELNDVYAGNQGIEDVIAGSHFAEGNLNTGLSVTIPGSMTVSRRHNHRLHACRLHGWGPAKDLT